MAIAEKNVSYENSKPQTIHSWLDEIDKKHDIILDELRILHDRLSCIMTQSTSDEPLCEIQPRKKQSEIANRMQDQNEKIYLISERLKFISDNIEV